MRYLLSLILTALDGELHLTRINALCSLQPQFHYLDAIAENEKSQGRGGRGADDLPEELHNLSLRSPDEEELDMNETGKTLRALQDEPWKPLEWIDEDVSLLRCIFHVAKSTTGGRLVHLLWRQPIPQGQESHKETTQAVASHDHGALSRRPQRC